MEDNKDWLLEIENEIKNSYNPNIDYPKIEPSKRAKRSSISYLRKKDLKPQIKK